MYIGKKGKNEGNQRVWLVKLANYVKREKKNWNGGATSKKWFSFFPLCYYVFYLVGTLSTSVFSIPTWYGWIVFAIPFPTFYNLFFRVLSFPSALKKILKSQRIVSFLVSFLHGFLIISMLCLTIYVGTLHTVPLPC